MANITKLEFVALDISGNNYLSWRLDVEIHLDAMGLGDTIKENNKASSQDRAKAMIFLCHHLHEGLKTEYLTVKDPLELWQSLKERYDHHKTVILPKARYDWMHLRLQDFKSVSEYNSAMFRISSQLILCGEKITKEDKLEKTFFTFHASNMLLQQQYRERGFKKYSELITWLLVAEQNNELLMKNHESRPTGSKAFHEVSDVAFGGRGRGCGRDRGRGRGRGCGRSYVWHRGGHNNDKKITSSDGKLGKGKAPLQKDNEDMEDSCFRCGIKGHWTRTCCRAKHLVDPYQASQNKKGKNVEANMAYYDGGPSNDDGPIHGKTDMAHLEVADLFAQVDGVNDSFNDLA